MSACRRAADLDVDSQATFRAETRPAASKMLYVPKASATEVPSGMLLVV